MTHKSNFPKKGFLLLYIGTWSFLLVGAAIWLTMFLVGTLGNPTNKVLASEDLEIFDSILALTDKKVVRYLGEWELLEPELPGHFHHIGQWYQSDEWNFCIECHGPTPHSRNVNERAFLNMHNLFTSCQVCHVQEIEGKSPDKFCWVDMTTGMISPNPEMAEGIWGEYGVKIIQLKESVEEVQPLSLEEEQEFAKKFSESMNTLSDSQKVIGNKFIHSKCVEIPVTCSDCHTEDSSLLPFIDLGYSEDRTAFLVSSEVVDMIKLYENEAFQIPNILNPVELGDASEEQSQ